MTEQKPIVVVGSLNMDLVTTANRIPVGGETVIGSDFQKHHGGKGANQAFAIARLGYPVELIGCVGSDTFGDELQEGLRLVGVGISGVARVNGPSGVATIIVSSRGENSIVVTPGANTLLSPDRIEEHVELIRSAAIVLTQLEIPIATVFRLAEICNREGVPLVVDPAPAQELPTELLPLVSWFTPNESEAQFYISSLLNGGVDPENTSTTSRALMRTGIKNVILKRGVHGVTIAMADGSIKSLPALSVSAVDSTAAGDSFNGAFATMLAQGGSTIESARFATAAAAISVTRRGAQSSMPTLAETQQMLEQALHADARGIFLGTLKACDIASSLDRRILFEGDVMHRLMSDGTGSSRIDIGSFREIFIVALGKAAGPMLDALLDRMKRRTGLRGIYCSNQPPEEKDVHFQFFDGGHPVPNENSFAAARAALALLKSAQKDTLIFFLISGGGSAMFELPLDPQITIQETIAFHQLLLGSGAPITETNILRKHFSAVKGGRLAMAAPEATKVNLLLADVPLQSLDALSSGPTFPNRATLSEVRELINRYALATKFPESVRNFFEESSLEEHSQNDDSRSTSQRDTAVGPTRQSETTPCLSGDDGTFRDSWFEILLSSHDLVENARAVAEKAGYYVVVDNSCDDWDYAQAARYLLEQFHSLRRIHLRLCLISVGEVTVTLNENPGAGGRNQQFVLQCALELDRYRGQRLAVLSAGSDGIDGNTQAAGAIANVTTVARAQALGYDAEATLAAFDSYPLFTALGDLVVTNPTGQNLRDLRLFISES